MPELIDRPRPPRRRFLFGLAIILALLFSFKTVVSYYIDALWFGSLGYGDVFWKKQGVQWTAFVVFAALTFLVLYGTFLLLKRAHSPELQVSQTILIGGQAVKVPVERFMSIIALVISIAISLGTGGSMMAEWPT